MTVFSCCNFRVAIRFLEQHNVKVKLFADDVKMYLKIVNDVCMQQLQLAINALTNWAQEWQLGISVDKCCVLNIGTEITASRLYPDNSALRVLTQTRDLGIIVNNSLSRTAHVMDMLARHIGVQLLFSACLLLKTLSY